MKNVCQQVGGSHYTVREVLQELKYNYTKLPLGNAKAAPLQGIVEVAEHTRPKDEDLVAQLKGTPEFAEHSRTKDDCVKNLYNRDSSKSSQEIQDVDDVLISPNDAVTSTGIVEKAETWESVGSSHHNVETEAGKHDLNTSETFKTAAGPTLSDQTESMKVIKNKSSISLGVEAKPDPGNQQRETEAKKLALENTEKILKASESSVSDQSGSDNVLKANIHDREHNPKHDAEESTSTGLFGSLKSFAYGFRNFWKKL
ncbi:hypothetical protein PAHAL_1G322700 [Panicum hallii]|nr:hypothetical protein PAHAL_1G322700 [Panicum hallii]PAN07264.1 hypothetical protein PAHAL_1G322700 [Panicum hallii]